MVFLSQKTRMSVTAYQAGKPFMSLGELSISQSENSSSENQGTERSLQLAIAAAQTAAEHGGRDIIVLDMREHTPMFDYFVIATGTSRRQLHAMSEEVDHKLEDELKDKRMNIDGYDDSKWIVLDYSTLVVHLFDEETREFYSLESLWADAEKLDLTGIVEQND